MNIKQISFLLIITGLFYNPITAEAKKPKPRATTKTENPQIEKQEYCVIRGFYEERKEGETVFHVCRLVSTAKCVAVPCNIWGPFGPQNKPYVNTETVPPNLGIQPGTNYIVKYTNNIPTGVQIVNQIQIQETSNTIEIHYN